MKRKLLLPVLLIAAQAVFPALAEDGLRVTPRSGESVVFLFSQEPEISFLSDKLKISSKDAASPMTMDLDEVAFITFEKNLSAAEFTESDGVFFFTDADGVHFRNVAAGTPVSVCDLAGKTLYSGNIRDAGQFDLSRGDYAGGVVIVRVGTLVAKVTL